jgi:hypothetical protein
MENEKMTASQFMPARLQSRNDSLITPLVQAGRRFGGQTLDV